MGWPRGKYNGSRIDGFKVSISLHVLSWFFKPRFSMNFGEPYLVWLFFTIRAELNYKD